MLKYPMKSINMLIYLFFIHFIISLIITNILLKTKNLLLLWLKTRLKALITDKLQ